MVKSFNKKSLDELESLNTKRLLAYYRAERKRYNRRVLECTCQCCGEFIWNLYPVFSEEKAVHDEHLAYVTLIKGMLDKREHVTN